MSKFLVILTIIFSINFNSAEAAGGGFLKALIQLFKGSGKAVDEGVSITDDVIKNLGKNTDDSSGILGSDLSKIKNLEETSVSYKNTTRDEQIILQKIGKSDHNAEFVYSVSRSKRKFKEIDNIWEIGEEAVENIFEESAQNSLETMSKNTDFYKFVLINWFGRVFRNSEYFSDRGERWENGNYPLVCKTDYEVFYYHFKYTLEEYQSKIIPRALLSKHSFISNREYFVLNTQELFVIKDEKKFKVMSTKPINDNKYPQHFFVVYGNQKFHHFYNPKGISPLEIFSKINSNTISTQNACYRVTRQGLFTLKN